MSLYGNVIVTILLHMSEYNPLRPDQASNKKEKIHESKEGMIAKFIAYSPREQIALGMRSVMVAGFFFFIAGMAFLAINRHTYEHVIILTLYLPALILALVRPANLKLFWQQSTTKWVILLIAWSMLSLLWSDSNDLTDWIGRNLGILLFLSGWIWVFKERAYLIPPLLFCCAAAITLTALVEMTFFHSQLMYRDEHRLMMFGLLHHPDLAAAILSAVIIWLCSYPWRRTWQVVACALMILIALAFLVWTQARSAWGGLFLALLVIAAFRGGRNRRWLVALLLLLGVAAALLLMPELTARGVSARPAILAHAWQLFEQHWLIGIGKATPVHLHLDTFMAWHAHNLFAQIAVQLGLPGLLVWLIIWLTLGYHGWRQRHEPLGCLVLATWVFTTFMGQFDLPRLINSPHVEWLLTWLPLAISYSLFNAQHKDSGLE
jgi:O-antigen ligase